MIWGYPYFRNPPYMYSMFKKHACSCASTTQDWWKPILLAAPSGLKKCRVMPAPRGRPRPKERSQWGEAYWDPQPSTSGVLLEGHSEAWGVETLRIYEIAHETLWSPKGVLKQTSAVARFVTPAILETIGSLLHQIGGGLVSLPTA